MLKNFLICLLLSCSVSMFAEGVLIGNIYYLLDYSNKTAKVTYTNGFSPAYNPNNYEGLETINIPTSVPFNGINYMVTEIGDSAFYMCSSLIQISISKEIKIIGKDALLSCLRLQYIYVDGASKFFCSEDNVLFNKSKTSLIKYPRAKQATSYSIPKEVKFIESRAFCYCTHLSSINIPSGIVEIREGAFSDCQGLLSLSIPNSVKIIGKRAFSNCRKISKIIVPNQVERIEDSAFSLCWSLKVIEIGSGVKEVGEGLFSHCKNLEAVICHAIIPPVISCDCLTAFMQSDKAILYVHKESLSLYKEATGWRKFGQIESL